MWEHNESTGKNTTTGFIDVEDSVTGYLLLQNCNSHDEGTNSAMLHCCTVDVKDCTLVNVLIYGGAWANVENTVCSSTIGYQAASVITPMTMTNCTGHYGTGYRGIRLSILLRMILPLFSCCIQGANLI